MIVSICLCYGFDCNIKIFSTYYISSKEHHMTHFHPRYYSSLCISYNEFASHNKRIIIDISLIMAK